MIESRQSFAGKAPETGRIFPTDDKALSQPNVKAILLVFRGLIRPMFVGTGVAPAQEAGPESQQTMAGKPDAGDFTA